MNDINIRGVLLDLDGTVIKSDPGIINGLEYAAKKMGYPIPPREELFKFIGPPFAVTLKGKLGVSKEDLEEFIKTYRDYYKRTGIYEISLYEGIFEVLTYLKQNNIPTFVATAKPEYMAEIIIDYLGLNEYFAGIYGMLDDKAHHKEDVINRALKEHLDAESTDCIMVGDTAFDMSAAKNLGLLAWGAKWGYGKTDDLVKSGAQLLLVKPIDIIKHLKKL